MDAARAPIPRTRVYRLNYISATDAKAYFTPLLGKDDEGGSVTGPPAPATGLEPHRPNPASGTAATRRCETRDREVGHHAQPAVTS